MDHGRSPRRRRHPARGARTVAVLASTASTAGLATWMALADGAFDSPSAASTGANLPGLSPDLIPAQEASAAGDDLIDDPFGDATDVSGDPFADDEPLLGGDVPVDVLDGGDVPVDQPLLGGDVPLDGGDVPVDVPGGDVPVDVSGDDVPVDVLDGDDVPVDVPGGDVPVGEPPGPVAYADGTYLGAAAPTPWGGVQVEVVVAGGNVVDVVTVQVPAGRRSTRINDRAIPLLEADAIAVQSADLDAVSGATYTSHSYADSIQAALDAAAIVEAGATIGGTV